MRLDDINRMRHGVKEYNRLYSRIMAKNIVLYDKMIQKQDDNVVVQA
jgi:hypothetical protein